jgi:hypothetical protein
VSLPDLDAAIDRLDDALRDADLACLEEPTDLDALDAVAEAVAPYELPDELRRYWSRVDPEKLAVRLFPALLGPASSLELQRVADEFPVPLGPPRLLFVIGYMDHVHRSIELATEWSEGGTIMRWQWVDGGYRIAYRSLADLLEVVAELVSERAFELVADIVYVASDAEEAKQRARLQRADPHPLYGDTAAIPAEVESWPAHWLAASGIDLRDREPLGATHTIAELVEAAGEGTASGRIAGTIVRAAGIGTDHLILVDDGTRQLDVWCPSGTSPWTPVHGRRFEFEITIDGPVPPPLDFDTGHAELQGNALAGRVEETFAAAEAFLSRLQRHRAPAVASDMRPLD